MRIFGTLSRGLVVVCLALIAPSTAAPEGLRSLFRASTKAPTTIETGPVSKACGLRGAVPGKLVEKGPGRWRLYDTAPGSTAAREFYLTGFSDGCPRRLTGAVAMFGSVDLYELVHYGPVGMKPTGAETDRAYARMRARTCGSAKKTCSERGLRSLSRSAVFVDVYASTNGPRRTQLLMSGGRLAAVSQK